MGGRKNRRGRAERAGTPLLDRPGVAQALGVSRATVERAAAGGALAPTRGGRAHVYAAAEALRAVTGDPAPCLRCWADSDARDGRPGSRPDRYARLVAERDAPGRVCCTPEEQAGPEAGKCRA